MDLKEVGCNARNCMGLAQDRDPTKGLCKDGLEHRGSLKANQKVSYLGLPPGQINFLIQVSTYIMILFRENGEYDNCMPYKIFSSSNYSLN